MSITVTESATQHFARILQQAQQNSQDNTPYLGIRIGVKDSGCAEYSYVIELAKQHAQDDTIFEYNQLKFFVNQAALAILDGTEIDYVPKGISKIIVFRNPNAVNECGCGESFSVKKTTEE